MIQWKIHLNRENEHMDKQWQNGIVDFAKLCDSIFFCRFIQMKWIFILASSKFGVFFSASVSCSLLCLKHPFANRHIITHSGRECWAINWSEMKDARWNILVKFVLFSFLFFRVRKQRQNRQNKMKESENERKKNTKTVNRKTSRREFQFFPFACRRKMSGIRRTCKLSTNSSWKITT